MEGMDLLGRPVAADHLDRHRRELARKTEMLACHASQREWLLAHHGIDEYLDSMRRHAAMRGGEIGVAAAEAFVQHRGHAYPHNDLLASCLHNRTLLRTIVPLDPGDHAMPVP